MIFNAINYIKGELDNYVRQAYQLQGEAVVLGALVDDAGKVPTSNQGKLVMSLVNMKEGQHMRNVPAISAPAKMSQPITLEMEVLVSAFFDEYAEALKFISAATLFFRQKSLFTAQNSPGLSANVEKLYLEVINLGRSELQDLWSTNGTHYRPSVLYKVTCLVVDTESLSENIPVITGISDK